MTALLLAKLAPFIIGAIGILAGFLGLRRSIRKDARQETALEAAERYAKQRKAIDDADANSSDDPAILRELLKHRDPGKR